MSNDRSPLERIELPQLPRGWTWTSLDALAHAGRDSVTDGPFGSNLKTTHYRVSGPRVIRLQNIGDGVFKDSRAHISEEHFLSLQRHKAISGDLVIAALGDALPRSCIVPDRLGPAIVKADCIRFRPDSDLVVPRFLNYALNFQDTRRRTSSIVHGIGRSRLNVSGVKSILIPLAPVNEQARIADAVDELLSDLDAGVAALNRVGKKLKLYRALVLKAAVEGTLTSEWRKQHPQVEPASELLARILVERRRCWEEDQLCKFKEKGREPPKNWKAKYKEPLAPHITDLPSLPKGWCWANTEQVCDFITKGTTPPGEDAPRSVGDVPFVKVQHLSETGAFWFSISPSFVSRAIHEGLLSRSKAFPGDVLMNIVGPPLGQVSVIPPDFPECNVNQAIAIFRPLDGLSKQFLANILVAKPVLERALRRTKTTAGQVNLTLEVCRDLPIPLPPFEEQEVIIEAVEGQLSVIDHLEADLDAKLESARALRQSILRHAFTGKLVPQDRSDEPAWKMLKRIAVEREQRAHEAAAAKRLKETQPRQALKARGRGKDGHPATRVSNNGRTADR